MKFQDIGKGRTYNADCFDVMATMPDGCVDMLFADLPYGTTACKWDSVIPFERLWPEINRICKPNAAMIFTASQPFSSALVMSNPKAFKYEWIWDKVSITGFANAKRQPLRQSESILVFYSKFPIYNPQNLIEANLQRKNRKNEGGVSLKGSSCDSNKGSLRTPGKVRVQRFTNYPRNLLKINREIAPIHPTQKPVALLEYLIKTYSEPGNLVFDPTAGSLTTGVAAENLGRRWVCCEMDMEFGYFEKGLARFNQ